MAEVESVPLDCSGPGKLFVFLCNFKGRSNQINYAPMTWFLSFSLQQRKLDPIGHRTENLSPFYVTALVFERYTLGGQENFVGM